MTTIHRISPAEQRRDRTTWVRDLKTGDAISSSFDPREIEIYLGHLVNRTRIEQITDGPCEGVEVVYVQTFHGGQFEPVAWVDEPPHSFTTDEINEALTPMRVAAE